MVVGSYPRPYDWSQTGLKVIPVAPDLRHSLSLARFSARFALRQAIASLHRHIPIDVVEWPDFQGLFLWKLRRGPVDVVRNHGPSFSHRLYGLTPGDRRIESREIRALRRIPNWIGVSHWFMKECMRMAGAKPKRTTVIYNPVDCRLFHPGQEERDQNVILYAGALIERKGVFALARASRLFLPELPQARLLFVGREASPGSRRRILGLAGEAVRNRIEFLDPLPQAELAAMMRRCAVFAMPSILESFGNVWAEAMACGTPVLGSSLTAGPEVVPHGEAGLLVDPERTEQIAAAVLSLMRNSELRARLGRRGREIALARYSVHGACARTIEFYRQCLQPDT